MLLFCNLCTVLLLVDVHFSVSYHSKSINILTLKTSIPPPPPAPWGATFRLASD